MQYFDLIFTLHSQRKLTERGIKMEDAYEAFKHPTHKKRGKFGDNFMFEREFPDFKLTVVARQNMKNEWVAKSAWRNPPLSGTADAREKETWKKYNKAGFFGQLWIQFKQQIGIKW